MNKNRTIYIKIAGGLSHSESFIKIIKNNFFLSKRVLNKINFKFETYDGINSKFTSGRIKRNINLDKKIINLIKYYNKNNITFSFVAGNHIINLKDTSDQGWELINILNEFNDLFFDNSLHRNGIIIGNELFRRYLRNNSNLKIVRSITSHPNLPKNFSFNTKLDKKIIDYYKKLEEKYDIIVPRFEMVFHPDFLKFMNLEKYQVIPDDVCIYNCPLFREHMYKINMYNYFKSASDHIYDLREHKTEMTKCEECWVFDPDNDWYKETLKYHSNGVCKNGMCIYEENELKVLFKYYNKIKLTGREKNDNVYFEDLKNYLLKLNDFFEKEI